MVEDLTRKERFLNTFERKKVDHLAFSPRLHYWYSRNKCYLSPGWFKKRGQPACENGIPINFLNKSLIEIFDLLYASPRYMLESFWIPLNSIVLIPSPIRSHPWVSHNKNGELVYSFRTKYGRLTKVFNLPGGGVGTGPAKEFYVKTLDDLKNLKYVFSNSTYFVFRPLIRYAHWKMGDRGVVSCYTWRSPYQRCIIDLLGFVRTTTFLKRYPREMEDFFTFLEEKDDVMYRKLAQSSIPIINFGENIDAQLTPPRLFEKYCMPYYERRVKQLHQAGKYCHIHMDGNLKDLLPYLGQLPFDGLEALTPEPAGDVTIEELKNAIGNKILLDGLPSTIFLPQYSMEYFHKYTTKLIETFSPNLILGVSDEMPPNGDIRKLELVSKIIEEYEPKY